jgi:arylsulfatase A-like enzyme
MQFKRHLAISLFSGYVTGFYFLAFGSLAYLSSSHYSGASSLDRLFVFKLQLFANLPLFAIIGALAALPIWLVSRRFHPLEMGAAVVYPAIFSLVAIYLQFKLFSSSWIVGGLPNILKILLYAAAALIVIALLAALHLLLSGRIKKRDSDNRLLAVEAIILALLILTVLAGFISPTTLWSAPSRGTGKGTNILLITVDTLRDDHLSYRGYSRETSPNLDTLASEGVVFENAYASCPRTFPSLSSVLTGRYVHRHGARNNFHHALPGFNLTLPEILKREGYLTGAVVTNVGLQARRGIDQGFDYYLETDHQNLQAKKVPALRLLEFVRLSYPLRSLRDNQAERTRLEAVKFIKRNRDRRFFLWVHFLDPHMDYNPPPKFAGLFDSDYRGRYRNHFHYGGIGGAKMIFDCPLGPAEIEHAIALYDGEIRRTDNEIGKLLDKLKEWGLYDDCLVIFSADHGESLGEHGYHFAHGDLIYNPCMHIPLVIRFPRGQPRKKVSTPVSNVDLMPTVLGFLHLRAPKGLDGLSLLPLILQDLQPVRRIFGESGISLSSGSNPRMGVEIELENPTVVSPEDWFPHWERIFNQAKFRMMIEDEWKMIYTPDGGSGSFELYSLARDPGEEVDLYEKETEIGERMRRQLLGWVAEDTLQNAEAIPHDKEMIANLQSIGYIR